jgi:hypothetical protein
VGPGGRAVPLPDELPVFALRGGRAVGRSLPPVEPGVSLAEWRDLVDGPFLLRPDTHGSALLAQVRRLATVGELWLDARPRGIDEALDLLVAGAARLRVDPADAEMAEAVGPSGLVAWDGSTPWEAVQAFALEHAAPVLAEAEVPAGAACDAFRVDGDRLVRVAAAPKAEAAGDAE